MSMKGSPIGWFKEKRQSSHSGISNARRPATAIPLSEDRDMAKIVEQAVLAAFESDAFKMAVASQVDPAFTRHQERLNQIRTTNLNLESILQSHVEDVPPLLDTIQNHLTGLVIPDYRQDLDSLALGQEKLERQLTDLQIPDYARELGDIASAQSRLLKTLESRFDGLASRIDDFDRKLGELDGSVASADLRSAIRFGEISNELQDRNTTLGDRVWGVERELGKKVDALQRKVVAACEDVGKSVRSSHEAVETMRAKLDEDHVLAAVQKGNSRAEFSEKALRRGIEAIQDKVASFDTAAISSQTAKLEVIERGISDFKKEAEAARNLASVSSKFMSANTSKLDNIAAAVGKMQIVVESTSETCQEVFESQEQNAGSIKEDVEAVRMHVRALDSMAVSHARKLSEASNSITRMESTLIGTNSTAISKLEDLESSISRVEDGLKPLSVHTTKMENLQTNMAGVIKDLKPHRAILEDLASTISELRSNVDTAISSHSESLEVIQQKVCDTSKVDLLKSNLSEVQSQIEQKISSSLELTSRSTVEQIDSRIGVVQAGLNSAAEHANQQAEKSAVSITELLKEVRSTQAFLESEKAEINEQFRSTKEVVEASQTAHKEDAVSTRKLLQDLQQASKDDEVLLQIESWTHTCISKQAAEIASVKEILETSRRHGEVLNKSIGDLDKKSAQIAEFLRSGNLESSSTARELAAIKSILENDTTLAFVKDSANTTEQAFWTVQASLQELKEDSAMSKIEHLALKNVASIEAAHESIHAIGSRVTSNEEAIRSTVREVQTALATDISNAATDIRTSTADFIAGLKTDLGSTITSSADALSVEVKAVDLSSTTTAVESLKEQLEEVIETALASNATSTAEQLTTVKNSVKALKEEISTSFQVTHDRTDLAAEDVKSSIATAIELLTTDVRDFGNIHSRGLQQNATSLANLEEFSNTQSASISEQLARIQKAIDPISGVPEDVALLLASAEELDLTTKSNAKSLSSIQESVLASGAELGAVSSELKTAIDVSGSKTLLAVEASQAKASELRQASEDQIGKVRGTIEDVDAALVKIAIEIGHANTSLTTLSIVCQDIPGIFKGAQEFEAVHHEAFKEFKASQAAILATVAGTATEVISVKSDIGSIADSLNRVDQKHDAASETQARVLSILGTNSTELHGIEEIVKQDSVHRKELSETLTSSISSLDSSILASNAELKTAVISEVATVGTSVTQEVSFVKTSLDKASSETKESLEALKLDMLGREKAFTESTTGSRATILSELEAIALKISEGTDKINNGLEQVSVKWEEALESSKLEITNRTQELHAVVAKSAVDAEKAQDDMLSGLRSEARSIGEAVAIRADRSDKAVESKLEAAQVSIFLEVENTKKALNTDLIAIQSSIKDSREALDKMSTDFSTRFDLAASESVKSHEVTRAALSSENKSISDVILREIQNANGAIDLAKGSVVEEIENTKSTLGSNFNSTQASLQECIDYLKTEIGSGLEKVSSETTKAHEAAVMSMQADSKLLLNTLVREVGKTNEAVEDFKQNTASASETTQAWFDSTRKSLGIISENLNNEFKAATNERRDIGGVQDSRLARITDSVQQQRAEIRSAVESAHQELLTEFGGITKSLTTMREILEERTDTLADSLHMGFSDATVQRTTASKAREADTAALSESIKREAETTRIALESTQDGINSTGVAADVKKTTSDVKHTMGGLKLQLEQMSDIHKAALVGLGEEMRCLDGKTHDRLGSLEAAGAQRHAALLGTMDQTSTSLHHTLDSLHRATGAVDAAVRVNSAAIAQVEMPRLETLARRNRDAVEVIGGRVIGTVKKFDEMVTHHGQKPAHGLERSEMLSASGRLRGGSNASSTRSRDGSYRISAMEIARDMARG
ncbi:hypothetical protein BUE80_DR013731 [Diplocarpon rosae]|nr:hypothetical protein BUE80_DR013731 [Diplocarpon rosae]